MINTYSGEMIKPRVGDICRYIKDDFYDDIEIKEVFDLSVRAESLTCENYGISSPENLTLLHRPFQVEDEYEYPRQEGVFSFVVESGSLLPLDKKCIHKNPSWRDHPDYEGKK